MLSLSITSKGELVFKTKAYRRKTLSLFVKVCVFLCFGLLSLLCFIDLDWLWFFLQNIHLFTYVKKGN